MLFHCSITHHAAPQLPLLLPFLLPNQLNHIHVCMQVHIKEANRSFLHFLTNVCAIVGGLFAVSGLIDGTVYHAEQVIRKKIDLGKHM